MPDYTATLELPPVDVDGDGTDETGIFEFTSRGEQSGGVEITQATRTGALIGDTTSEINSLLSNALDPGESKNKTPYAFGGLGQRIVQITFREWDGHDGAQWGTGAGGSATPADATGATSALEKMQVLDHYVQVATPDSITPAYLQYGGYSDGGLFDTTDLGLNRLPVAIEDPEFTVTSHNTIEGQMTLLEVVTADRVVDNLGKSFTGR